MKKLQLILFLLLFYIAGQAQIITTVAGGLGDGGVATNIPIGRPEAIAIDGAGNLYFTDNSNNRIRKVSATTGVISTVAGNFFSRFGGDGGLATEAYLNNPTGIAVDIIGNLYIADANNNRIRKVSAVTGIINTIAGNGTVGFSGDGDLALAANLNSPRAVSVDSFGNVYIVDFSNNRIRKVSAATGIITTLAGNGNVGFGGDGGAATSASLNISVAVALDVSGNLSSV